MFEEIDKAIAEVQQPRSRFQLERFVLGQHATLEMQYYQVCLELQDTLHKIRINELAIKKSEIKIQRLRNSNDEIDQIEAEINNLELQQTKIAFLGAQRELAHLVEIWNSFNHKYTRKEIEAAQPEYWKARLFDNAEAMILGQGTVNPAHLETMKQAGTLEEFLTQQREIGNVRNLEA